MKETTHQEIVDSLENWNWPPRPTIARRRRFRPLTALKWAAVLGVGGLIFMGGRRSGPAPDLAGWEARHNQRAAAQLASAVERMERSMAGDRQALLDEMRRAQAQHTADLIGIRRDLETVAATAEERLLRTQQSLILLANEESSHTRPR